MVCDRSNPKLEKYPAWMLKTAVEPTTNIVGKIERFDEREHGFNRAARGDFGPRVKTEWDRGYKFPLSAAQSKLAFHLRGFPGSENRGFKAPLPEDSKVLTAHIKDAAYYLGAELAGVCELPSYAVYKYDMFGQEVHLDHKYAIVMLVDQGYKTMNASTGYDWISDSQSYIGYVQGALLTQLLAEYIRQLGYSAKAQHMYNYQVVMPPLVMLSGLGEMSRIGVTVNPFLGPRFKACAVTTDLPLECDRPIDFGLQDFCRRCKKCALECPAGAISKSDKKDVYNGYETYRQDIEACAKFRVLNSKGAKCGRCIKVCPWNKPPTWWHYAACWAAQHYPLAGRGLLWLDGILGYGKAFPEDKWWLDLEIVGDEIFSNKNRERG